MKKLFLLMIFSVFSFSQTPTTQLGVDCASDFSTCSISATIAVKNSTDYLFVFATTNQLLGNFTFGKTSPGCLAANENDMFFDTGVFNLSVCHQSIMNPTPPVLIFASAPVPTPPTPTPGPTPLTSGYITPMGIGPGGSTLWAGEGILSRMIVDQFVATQSGTFARVSLPTGIASLAGKAMVYGIYDAGCTTLLGFARGVALPTGAHELLFSTPIKLVAGTIYNQAFSSESEVFPLSFGSNGTAGAGALLFSATTNSHFIAVNKLTGTGLTYTFPATCGGAGGFSYYGVVTPLLRP